MMRITSAADGSRRWRTNPRWILWILLGCLASGIPETSAGHLGEPAYHTHSYKEDPGDPSLYDAYDIDYVRVYPDNSVPFDFVPGEQTSAVYFLNGNQNGGGSIGENNLVRL